MPYCHKGKSNPFFQHQHSDASKQKISESQKLRLKKLRTLVMNLSEAKLNQRIKDICHEEMLKYDKNKLQ